MLSLLSSASDRLTGTRSFELRDRLKHAVLLDREVGALELGDETSGIVANGDGMVTSSDAARKRSRTSIGCWAWREIVATKAIASPRQP